MLTGESHRFFPPALSKLTSSRRILLLSLSFCLFQTILFTQPPIEWDEAYGGNNFEELQGLHQTPDGGFIYGCSTPSVVNGDISEPPIGGGDFWLVKTDADGNILWENRMGGTDAEVIQEVQPTSDGGYILGGWSYSNISGDKTEMNNGPTWTSDIWVVKTDAAGVIQWDRSLGGDDNEQLYHIQETADGGFVIAGWSASGISGTKTEANQGGWDFYAIKLDATGATVWDKTFGGAAYDMMLDIDEAADGSLYMGGWSGSDVSGNKTDPLIAVIDYWVIKTDNMGNKIWDKAYGGDGNDQIQSLEILDDGNILFGGFSDSNVSGNKTEPNEGLEDMWVIKADTSGAIIWQKNFGGTLKDVCTDLHETDNKVLLIGGYSRSPVSGNKTDGTEGNHDYWIIKADSLGNKIWDVAYGGSSADILSNFKQTDDGGYILGGFSASNTSGDYTDANQGFNDAWVVKLKCDLEIDTIPDEIICETDAVTFNISDPYCFGCSYLWDDGNTDPIRFVAPPVTTVYEVTVTNSFGCTLADTTTVYVNPLPLINLDTDTTICSGDIATLDAGNTGTAFVWSTGETTQMIDVSISGTYSVTVTDTMSCSASSSIDLIIQNPPAVNLGGDLIICDGVTEILDAGNPGDNFNWSTGESTQTIQVDTAGVYMVTVTDDFGCCGVDSMELFINTVPIGTIAGDTTICEGESVPITFNLTGVGLFDIVFSENGSNVNLNNQSEDITLMVSPSATTTYTLISITDSNSPVCTSTPNQSVTVIVDSPSTTNIDEQICLGDSIFLENDYQFISGVYLDTFLSIAGCDSIVITDLFVAPINEVYIDLESCNPQDTGLVIYNLTNQYNCDSIIFETTSLLFSDTMYIDLESCNPQDTGLVIYNLTNQNNCDSIIYETTILLPSDTIYIDLESCNPQDTGLVIYNLTNQNNCDSIIYETTSLMPSDTMYIDLESCNPQDTGLVIYNLTNQNNCDSIIFEMTSLMPSDTMYIDLESCNPQDTGLVIYNLTNQNNCDSIIFETTSLLSSDTMYIDLESCNPQDTGLVIYNLTNQNNCDSIIFETTSLLSSDTMYIDLESCNPQDTGLVIYNLTNQNNCDSIIFETTSLLLSDTTYVYETSCNPLDTGIVNDLYVNGSGCDSLVVTQTDYLLSDTTYLFDTSCNPQDTGQVTETYAGSGGCDSLVVTQIDLLLSDTTYQIAISCNMNEVGESIEVLQTSTGCDSVIVTTTSFAASDTTYLFETSCNPQDTGQVTETYSDSGGCDSLVVTQIDLLLSDTTYLMATSCNMNEVGESIEVLQTSTGCDSVIVTTTSFAASDTTYLFETSCNPQDTGQVTETYSDSGGCDSLVVTQIDLLLSDTTYLMATSCNMNEVGESIEVLQTSTGCDSVIVTTTSFAASDTTYLFETSCNPQDTGQVTETYSDSGGCDSLVVTQIDLLLSDTTYLMTTSCNMNEVGESIEVLQTSTGCDSVIVTTTSFAASDTTYLFDSSCNPQDTGQVTETYAGSGGCDSLVVTQIDLLLSDTTYQMTTSCDMNEVGESVETLQTSAGCDSVIVITTSLVTSDTTYLFDTSCNPQDTGQVINLYANSDGCDSLVITDVALLPSDTTYLFEASCNPQDTGLLVTLENNQNGCDSIIILQVNLLPSDTMELFFESCNPQDTGTSINVYNNQNGCDSIEVITTNLLPLDSTLIAMSSCNPDDVGEEVFILENQYGCDSTIIISTSLLPGDETYFTEFTCDSEAVISDTTWLTNVQGCDSLIIFEILLQDLDFIVSEIEISCFNENDGVLMIDSVIGGTGPYLYRLNDNPFSQFNEFYNLAAGTYELTVMDAEGCEASQSFIFNNPPEFIVLLGDNRLITLGDSVGLEPLFNLPINSFTWAPTYNFNCDSCLNQMVRPLFTTAFEIMAISDNGCIDYDELMIMVRKDRKVFVPTVFSPNGDGVNDHFKIYMDQSAINIQTFRIFNRWGELIHEEQNVAPELLEGWDGRFKDQDLNPGVFVYVAQIEYLDGRVELIKGDVTLIR